MASGRAQTAGDVEVTNAQIITSAGKIWDIRPQLADFILYEDIFTPFLSGKVVLRDAIDLTKMVPFIGEEFFQVTFKTPGYPEISLSFMIVKCDSRVRTKERELSYTLHFISTDAWNDIDKKISKKFEGNIGDIYTEVMKTDKQGLMSARKMFIEKPINTMRYVSNMWSPSYNASFLASGAVSPKGSPSYLAFENADGFYFQSVQKFLENPPVQKFIYGNLTDKTKGTGGSIHDIDHDYRSILDFRVREDFNFLDRIDHGMLGTQMFMYDTTVKRYHMIDRGTSEYNPKLNEHTLWNYVLTSSKTNQMFEPRMLNNQTGYGDTTSTNTIQQRMALLSSINGHKLEIAVPGRTDYRAGDIVEVNIPKSAEINGSDDNDATKDSQLSGKYMVSAINHSFTRQEHKMTMELIKDSYMQQLFGG